MKSSLAPLLLGCLFLILAVGGPTTESSNEVTAEKIVGMYIHQHWGYNRPYAARMWTLDDWHGYLDGLQKLGYNTILVWPVVETIPSPMTESDQAHLRKMSRLIDMAHEDFGIRIYFALCPNVAAKDDVASRFSFEERPFFYSDYRVDPGNPTALAKMLEWHQRLIAPLAKADGVMIIDSDPGGYPGSNNLEFISLLSAHRKMLDRLRPGIELYYWFHAGWPAYSRFYQTGVFKPGSHQEFGEAFRLLSRANPEPWGLAGKLERVERLGLGSRVINLNYGAIEQEPSFPLTKFWADKAYEAGRDLAPRGVMGNAQTHCLQLPNTFAFARGASGRSLTRKDFVDFANRLLPKHGETIVEAWELLAGNDSNQMMSIAKRLEIPAGLDLPTGDLRGLLFGSPQGFLRDLSQQLRLLASLEEFSSSIDAKSPVDSHVTKAFADFVRSLEEWQKQHGYKNRWKHNTPLWLKMTRALKRLNNPEIDKVIDENVPVQQQGGQTWPSELQGFERVKDIYARRHTYTPRLVSALRAALNDGRPENRNETNQ